MKVNSFTPSSFQHKLSIRSESIQRIYNFYINNLFYVNRRYQRKLVWTIEEKRAFVDSILQGFPVPIILLAETERESKSVYEIIDGMQRLNAITSFIEGEFDLDNYYFDLQTMVESKSLLDKEKIRQKSPTLHRNSCEIIASYVIPLSIYSFNNEEKIDEIFRRINSNGKFLSRQELRSAGTTSSFANIVRLIASEIRSDASSSDILLLNDMKEISITNKQLEYGIKVDDIFWVSNRILTKDMLRESRDEEIIADIVAYMLLQEAPISSAEILDKYYGFKEDNGLQSEIELSLNFKDSLSIQQDFIKVYDQIRQVLSVSGEVFRSLIGDKKYSAMVRQFQVIFLSFYELLIKERLKISNYDGLLKELNSITKDISISPGRTWSKQNKIRNIKKITALIRDYFKERESEDPANDNWLTEFETLLTQSITEQALFDFKQGFTELNTDKKFSQDNFDKIIKTLTAMANYSNNAIGYVCVGVADNHSSAKRICDLYQTNFIRYKTFEITGIGHEAEYLQGNLDSFYKWIIQKIDQQPIDQAVKTSLCSKLKIINYKGKSVAVFSLGKLSNPAQYDGKFYNRRGANVHEIDILEYPELFKRFSEK